MDSMENFNKKRMTEMVQEIMDYLDQCSKQQFLILYNALLRKNCGYDDIDWEN